MDPFVLGCKLAYSARVVPPDLHRQALTEFSESIKVALAEVLNTELDDRSWTQAKLASWVPFTVAIENESRTFRYAETTGPRPWGRADSAWHDGRGPVELGYWEGRQQQKTADRPWHVQVSLACGQSAQAPPSSRRCSGDFLVGNRAFLLSV